MLSYLNYTITKLNRKKVNGLLIKHPESLAPRSVCTSGQVSWLCWENRALFLLRIDAMSTKKCWTRQKIWNSVTTSSQVWWQQFTLPSWGFVPVLAGAERASRAFFSIRPSSRGHLVAKGLRLPNDLCFSLRSAGSKPSIIRLPRTKASPPPHP